MTATTPPSNHRNPAQPALLELSRAECLRLLAGHHFGRVAVHGAAGYPLLRPVNYVFDPRSQAVVFRTDPGSKLHALLRSAGAAFEIDGIDPVGHTGWSVIVRGVVEEVTDRGELRRLSQLGVEPWEPGDKQHWMMIRTGTVSGRRLDATARSAVRRSPATARRQRDSSDPFRVVIAGGGVAAVETALALHATAPELIHTTWLAPEPDFTYRAMRVKEPFAYRAAQCYPLADIARDTDAELVVDSFKWLEGPARTVHTDGGQRLGYDALVLAMGARMRPAFSHALTIDDRYIDEQLHGLIQDVEEGYVHSIAFVAPPAMPWPLPLYELALMTARRAYDMQSDVSVTVATPEPAPLAIFGGEVSEGVERLLERNGILTITSARCSVPAAGRVGLDHEGRTLHVDRVVALPELFGPSTPGLPGGPQRGFIAIDSHCRVKGTEAVFAAGDATDFPIKHGGIAAQQADTAVQAIVAAAGLPIEPQPFVPELHAMLLGADKPLYLSARVTGGHGSQSTMSAEPTWTPAGKISGRYLTPYLESFEERGAVEPVHSA